MLKVSDLLGKPLISLADAASVGYVSNLVFDSRITRVKSAEITCDEEQFPEYTYIRFSAMRCDGDAAVVKAVSSSALTQKNQTDEVSPINRRCFNQSGKDLGHVRDLEIDKSAVVKIICDKATFTPKELLSLGDNMCIFNDTGVPVKISKPRRPAADCHTPKPAPRTTDPQTFPSARSARNSTALQHGATALQHGATARPYGAVQTAMPSPVASHVQTPTPPHSVTVTRTPGDPDPVKDYSFLLGKPVRTPVVERGKILIPAGEVVTEQTIETARKAGKLVQLALRAY